MYLDTRCCIGLQRLLLIAARYALRLSVNVFEPSIDRRPARADAHWGARVCGDDAGAEPRRDGEPYDR